MKKRKKYMDDDNYIFVGKVRHGGHISNRAALEMLSRGAAKAGLYDQVAGNTSMRKTFGYWAFKGGAGIKALQRIYGHTNPLYTLNFIGVFDEESIKDADIDIYNLVNL